MYGKSLEQPPRKNQPPQRSGWTRRITRPFSSPLMPARTEIPRLTKGMLVPRTHLLQRMTDAKGLRGVVLQSPAGSGKTQLLHAWRRELISAGVDVAWVSLSTEDNHPAVILDSLIAALGKVDPALVREARMIVGRSGDDKAIEAVAISLVRATMSHPRELAIFFDDVHHLRAPHPAKVLQLLVDYAPPGLQFTFASRGILPLSLGRLRSQQQLLELGFEDLQFSLDECAQLIQNQLSTQDPRMIRVLHEQTGGWVAGLKLLCLEQRQGKRDIGTVSVRDPQSFAQYFEQEVLEELPPSDREFLLHCALPSHFNAELCSTLMGTPEDLGASHRRILDLDSRGLFLSPANPEQQDGWWCLHPLLRSTLQAQLSTLSPEKSQAMHMAAWWFFDQHDMPYEAVQHALQAGQADAAIARVESSAQEFFVHGELRQLVRLVRLLPPAMVRQRFGLRLWLAWAQLYQQQLQECARSIAELSEVLDEQPPVVRYRLTLLKGLLAIQQDDSRAAIALLPELMSPVLDADALALTGRRALLTWIHIYQGEYDRARQIQFEEPAPLVDSQPMYGTAIGVLAGKALIGFSHAVQGQMIQAERIYRDVLFEVERRGPSCTDPGSLVIGMLAEVLYELNDAKAAFALTEPRMSMLEQVSIPDTRLRVTLMLARSHWFGGRQQLALEQLAKLQGHAEKHGLDRLHAYALLEQIRFRVSRRELDQARQLQSQLEVLDERHSAAHTGTVAEIYVVAERGRILLMLERGDLDDALQRIDMLADLCEQRGRARRVPFMLLQSAIALRHLGRHKESMERVSDALQRGHRLGLVRSMLDAHEEVPQLIRDYLHEPHGDPILRFYAEQLDAAANTPMGGPPQALAPQRPGTEVLSPREAEIVQLLTDNLSNKRIANALDVSLQTVKWHLKNIYSKLGVASREDVLNRLKR